MGNAFQYIKKRGGIATEKDYPYQGKDGPCDKAKARHKLRLRGYRTVPANREQTLKAMVARHPVSVAIDADGYEFQLYARGIFDGFCGTNLNHGVTVIGYGESKGKRYWLVKNSWGTGWGERGYIRMKRDSSNRRGICGIAMEGSYPI